MTSARGDDRTVALTIPARPEFLRLARLAAADVGARSGLSYDDIDDLKIAVDELCFAVMGDADGGPGARASSLSIRFTTSDDAIEIEGSCDGPGIPELNDLSRAIVTAVVQDYELDGSGASARFRMVKRVPTG
jgi:anti-sigma regulatory factor (Ser/Thr protein kinase)